MKLVSSHHLVYANLAKWAKSLIQYWQISVAILLSLTKEIDFKPYPRTSNE